MAICVSSSSSNCSPTLPPISHYPIPPSKPSIQAMQVSPPLFSSFSEESLAVTAAAQAVAIANAAAQAARDAVSSASALSQIEFHLVEEEEEKGSPVCKRKRRRKKREKLSEFEYLDKEESSLRCRYSNYFLTPTQEAEFSLYLKEGLRLEAARKKIREAGKGNPTTSQWAKAVGMKRGSLEKMLYQTKQSRERIALSYKRLIVSIATPYQGRGLSLQDLVQEGSIGLLQGAERFDYRKGYKLSTYVYWWIKQAIIKAIARKSRIVRLPGSMCAVVAKIAQANTVLRERLGRWPTYNEIAEMVVMSVSSVRLICERSRHPVSLDRPLCKEGMTLKEMLPGPEETMPEVMVSRQVLKKDLEKLLNTLTKREEYILRLYFGLNGETARSCDEIGRLLKLSRERVRQIHGIALTKLRQKSTIDSLRVYMS